MRSLLSLSILAVAVCGCASKPPTQSAPLSAMAETPPATAYAPPAPAQAGGAAPLAQQGLQEQFAAAAGERVFFALDSTRLSADALTVLDRQAEWLRAHPSVTVLIAGNCDERGTREYNIALGARRASAVFDYLVGRGVAASRMRTISYGKERPLDPGSNEDAWARNRNAHTMVGV